MRSQVNARHRDRHRVSDHPAQRPGSPDVKHQDDPARARRHRPDRGPGPQLTGTSGDGVRIAIAVACPIGATGAQSTVTVSQGTALGQASFTPTCDRFSHTVVLAMTASQGPSIPVPRPAAPPSRSPGTARASPGPTTARSPCSSRPRATPPRRRRPPACGPIPPETPGSGCNGGHRATSPPRRA